MQLIEPEDYYRHLLEEIPRAEKLIVLAAMMILADRKTQPVLALLGRALERGVRVQIVVDSYVGYYKSAAVRDAGETAAQRRELIRHTEHTFEQLQAKGARVVHVGKVGLNPFAHRCHAKVTIVDDIVYSFGGVNFTSGSFGNADFMLRTQSSRLADRLAILMNDIGNATPMTDFTWPLDRHHEMLFDAGAPRKSIIYERACELAAQSVRVWYVSQMVPSGRLGKVLRRTRTASYFNRPEQGNGVLLAASFLVDRLMSGVVNLYRRPIYIHAKFMLFELKDGSKALLSGSNNFSWRGVAYGTKEIALCSTDEVLWQRLYDFMQKEII